MSYLRSFSVVIESLTLTGGSVEDILLTVEVHRLGLECRPPDVGRITQERRLLHLPRARSVKKTVLRRMTDFDDVTLQEQFRFTKTEFLVILSNMEDQKTNIDVVVRVSTEVITGNRCTANSTTL